MYLISSVGIAVVLRDGQLNTGFLISSKRRGFLIFTVQFFFSGAHQHYNSVGINSSFRGTSFLGGWGVAGNSSPSYSEITNLCSY
jgi:hypothetical protein